MVIVRYSWDVSSWHFGDFPSSLHHRIFCTHNISSKWKWKRRNGRGYAKVTTVRNGHGSSPSQFIQAQSQHVALFHIAEQKQKQSEDLTHHPHLPLAGNHCWTTLLHRRYTYVGQPAEQCFAPLDYPGMRHTSNFLILHSGIDDGWKDSTMQWHALLFNGKNTLSNQRGSSKIQKMLLFFCMLLFFEPLLKLSQSYNIFWSLWFESG